MPVPPLRPELINRAREMRARGCTMRKIANALGIGVASVNKYAGTPTHDTKQRIADIPLHHTAAHTTTPRLPPSIASDGANDDDDDDDLDFPPSEMVTRSPCYAQARGRWLVLSDVHIPVHHPLAVKTAVQHAKRTGRIDGVLLNGDIMDMCRMTPFYREPLPGGVRAEIEAGRMFLGWLRAQFPHAEMIYRAGNHEERWRKYIISHADELHDLEELALPSLLEMNEHSIVWVQDKRLVYLGKLATLHGHELTRGGGVNPARYAFLKTGETVLVGHWHQTSQHTQRRPLSDGQTSCWSTGCLCSLSPDYMPYGQSNHGFAIVEVDQAGAFQLHNLRIKDGHIE